ncbi:uncharacterized protein BDW47DRAFT_100590 [Aspergillus candidus]|uniref:Uncharacterized protein n=1 Tax=Aspergillus candidus TaxID=41067 RepID=A0A2I2FJ37_ASPCN|nr:hypothetical protein BDW47DRAFT_100590 [Aspergillus candidus]PLB40648.1 hypothetical protein BDW47DRAFT_100590 [Aspergillus candidus]
MTSFSVHLAWATILINLARSPRKRKWGCPTEGHSATSLIGGPADSIALVCRGCIHPVVLASQGGGSISSQSNAGMERELG